MIKIEKGVKIPEKNKYPFTQMELNDSFFVPAPNGNEDKTRSSLSAALTAANKSMRPIKFTLRKLEGGFRVWRVN